MPLCSACCRNCCAISFKRVERLGRDDDELHRQADTARQRRRLKRGDPHAGDLVRVPAAEPAADRWWSWSRWSHGLNTMPAIDWPGTSSWKTCSVSGCAAKISIDLPRIKLALLQRRIRRRDRLRDDDALVLLRRQLGLGAGEQEIDAAQHDRGEHQRHRQRVQAAVQPPFIAAAQPVEAAVDESRQPRLPAAALGIVRP